MKWNKVLFRKNVTTYYFKKCFCGFKGLGYSSKKEYSCYQHLYTNKVNKDSFYTLEDRNGYPIKMDN